MNEEWVILTRRIPLYYGLCGWKKEEIKVTVVDYYCSGEKYDTWLMSGTFTIYPDKISLFDRYSPPVFMLLFIISSSAIGYCLIKLVTG